MGLPKPKAWARRANASRLVLDAWIEEELGKCMGLKLIMIRWGLQVSGWIEKSGMECKEWLGLGSAVLPRVHFKRMVGLTKVLKRER